MYRLTLDLCLSFDEFPPALNGNNGLIRMHYRAYMAERDAWIAMVRQALTRAQLDCFSRFWFSECAITYTRRSIHRDGGLDWDNMAASFKVLGDALVANGILEDDCPCVVKQFIPIQVRVHRKKEQGITVEIQGRLCRKPNTMLA